MSVKTNLAAQQGGGTLGGLALGVAVSQLGESEVPKGSNSGPQVDTYLASVGLGSGFSWCQAFVYWCYREAAKMAGCGNPAFRTASVADCWNKTSAEFKTTKIDALKNRPAVAPGSQVIFLYGRGLGHTGLVEHVDEAGIHTIEGNSNTDGSREGYEVVRHVRRWDDPHLAGFIGYEKA
jgi:CHAP domain